MKLGIRKRTERTVVQVSGKDRAKFLHGMLTCDVKGLPPMKWTQACMVSNKGKLLSFFHLYNRGDDLLIDIDRTLKEATLATLKKYKIIEDVTFTDLSEWTVTTIVGSMDFLKEVPGALEMKPSGEGLVATATTPADPTYHMLQPKPFHTDAAELTDEEWETLRVESGIPIYGRDVSEENLPLESAYLEKGVSYTKGCYIGQETIIRVAHRGGHVAHKLMGIEFEKPVEIGSAVFRGDKEVGKITSTAFSKKLGKDLGMGMIHREAFEPGTEVKVSNQVGKVVPLPLP
jgi:tRNA-modifying protein YgfZ